MLAALKERPDLFQKQLGMAKQIDNAKCFCQPNDPIAMVVRQLKTGRILATWPGTLQSHAKECPFFGQSAIVPMHQHRDEVVNRKKAQLIYRDGWVFGSSSLQTKPSDECVQVDLRWLLEELWQASLLNSWRSEWRRDWSFIKRRVTSAASSMMINDESLALHLHVVEPFSVAKKSEINQEWDTFVTPLVEAPFNLVESPKRQHFRIGLVLGELSSARLVQGTWVLQLRHHFEEFGLVPEAVASIDSRLTSKLQQMSFGVPHRPVVMMCIAVDDLGLFHVLDMTLMEVCSRWLPGTLNIEKELVRILIERRFEFHITKGHKWGGGLPFLICRNEDGKPWNAIYTYSTSTSPVKVQQYQTKMLTAPINAGRKCIFVGYDHPIEKMLSGL